MTAVEELNTKIDALEASAQAANDKADALIAGNAAISTQVTDLQAQIAELQAAGNPTAEDLNAIGARVDTIKASLDEQIGQDDAALTPVAPAPTPEEPQA